MSTQSRPLPSRGSRSTHTIKAGESLASLALKHYGDARFAKLLITINRGEIQTRSDGFSNFAFVFPGLMMALPTYEEANIFRNHFFTKQSNSKFDLAFFARPAMPSDSISMEILPSQGSRTAKTSNASASIAASPWPALQNETPAPFLQNMKAAPATSSQSFEWQNGQSDNSGLWPSPIEQLLPALPQLTISESAHAAILKGEKSLNQYECQYIVKMPTPKSEQELIDMEPPTVSVARLQDRAAMPTAPEVVAFSHYCRMIKFDAEGGQSDTIIKLQVLEDTRWQTITAYIITEQTSRRLAHYADKQNQAIEIDLPSEVARELSISDLKRNWKHYVQTYLSAQNKLAAFAMHDNSMLPAC